MHHESPTRPGLPTHSDIVRDSWHEQREIHRCASTAEQQDSLMPRLLFFESDLTVASAIGEYWLLKGAWHEHAEILSDR